VTKLQASIFDLGLGNHNVRVCAALKWPEKIKQLEVEGTRASVRLGSAITVGAVP